MRKVSLWLGHASLQSTEVYLRADPAEKLEALSTRARPALPVIDFVSARSPREAARYGAAFHTGLSENGTIDGQNVDSTQPVLLCLGSRGCGSRRPRR